MRLAYYQHPGGNFGDALNPWLWDQLAPGLIDGEGDILIGMGTLIGRWFDGTLPPGGRRVVLGAGAGKDAMPHIANWAIYGVRGPLTCAWLDIDPALSTADPAVCLRDLVPPPDRRAGVGFMPHYLSLEHWDWADFCRRENLVFVDPHADPLETVRKINGLERLLSEAMHGAIVADALRVPWVALRISPDNYTGKWDDWGASIGLPIYFKHLPDLYASPKGAALFASRSGGRPASGRWELAECRRLIEGYRQWEPQLSAPERLDGAIARFRTGLERLLADKAAGQLR